nr:D-alanine--D-alanine ligase [candidate division Zixibacteria bacterium]
MKKKLNILILAGGYSEERDVSLSSSRAIFEALVRRGHQVAVIDSATGQSLTDGRGQFLLVKDKNSTSKIALKDRGGLALTKVMSRDEFGKLDVVFLGLHGGAGEDGTIQAVLDLAGVKYTGSGRLASAVAMDKAFTKRILNNEEIPTPSWILYKNIRPAKLNDCLGEIKTKFDFPVIIKPNNSGSTCGLTLVKNEKGLRAAFDAALEVSMEVLVEKYIQGREITAALLNGRPLPLVEIVPSNELYDYQCKYTKGKSQYICPAQIPENITGLIQNLAVRAYDIIGCAGLARVDFILDDKNRPYFLEINTLPGMTELSLSPMAASEAGISFDDLVEEICRAAIE